jgi:hypothetical protein
MTRQTLVNEANAWAITLAFLMFMMFLTASPRARYRTVFDPHLYFGLFALADVTVAGITGARRRLGGRHLGLAREL